MLAPVVVPKDAFSSVSVSATPTEQIYWRNGSTVYTNATAFGAVAAGHYARVEDAMEKMGSGFDAEYTPNKEVVQLYEELYQRYLRFGRTLEKEGL